MGSGSQLISFIVCRDNGVQVWWRIYKQTWLKINNEDILWKLMKSDGSFLWRLRIKSGQNRHQTLLKALKGPLRTSHRPVGPSVLVYAEYGPNVLSFQPAPGKMRAGWNENTLEIAWTGINDWDNLDIVKQKYEHTCWQTLTITHTFR